jgi:predicted MFS family arabinose efflux permease
MPPDLGQPSYSSSDSDPSEPLLQPGCSAPPPKSERLTSVEERPPSEPPVSRNVTIVLIYTFFLFAGRSIWNQNVLATFVYLLRDGDAKAVGFTTAAMGISQLIVSVPSGFLADRYRRDTMLKFASLLGAAAAGTTIVALHHTSYAYLVVALCVWGVYYGVANTGVSALFADSIRDGQRAHYFTTRSIILNFGNMTGPIVALVMFLSLGDKWTIKDCSSVMAVGQFICMPAVFLLCFLSDDATADNNVEESTLTTQLLQDEQRDEESNGNEDEVPENQSENLPSNTDHETFDKNRLAAFVRCLPENRAVAILVASADVTAGLASGMSVRYFSIFLYDNLNMSPVNVQILYIIAPLVQATLMKVAQHFAQTFGRCRIAVAFKWTGIILMFSMVVSYVKELPVGLTCTILILRTAFMNSTSALTKSVLMDNIPKEERAKWSSLESLNMFSWSGSAALGGILVDHRGIVFNFCVTACLQILATTPILMLSFFSSKTRSSMGRNERPTVSQS